MVKVASLTGQIINGRYTIESIVGEGTFGVVWRARDEKNPMRFVAVKILRESYAHDAQVAGRFHAEARALELLRHPSVVGVIEHGVWQGMPYLVMEYIDGVTLASWLRELVRTGAPPPRDMVRAYFDDLCSAVAAAHEIKAPGPIVHRDLKPSNVMLRHGGAGSSLAVLDFGIAQLGARNGTQSGMRMGTPTYMSPEQAMGNVSLVGPWSDVFSLAVMLFEMLTLRATPTDGETFWGIAIRGNAHIEAAIAPWRSAIPDVVYPVLLRALRLDARERIASAPQLRDALRAVWGQSSAVYSAPGVAPTQAMPTFGVPFGGASGGVALPQNSMPYTVAPLFPQTFSAQGQGASPALPGVMQAGMYAAGPQVASSSSSGSHGAGVAPGPNLPVVGQVWRPPAGLSQNRAFVPSASLQQRGAGSGRGAWYGSIVAAICGVGAFVALVVHFAAGSGGAAAPRDCDHGGAEACLQDGIRFSDGPVTIRDDVRALRVLRVACGARLAEGCYRTANALEHGRGTSRDYGLAVSDYGVACDQGHKMACTRLAGLLLTGRGVRRDEARARTLLTRACDQGELQACNDLGDVYRDGRGIPRDLPRATELHQRACNGGNLEGCDSVGMAYRDGVGVTADPPRAVQLFETACNGGNMEACGDLGDMVYEGRGVARNVQRGLELIQRACDGGYDQGCVQLGQLYASGTDVRRDEAVAVSYFQRACDHDWGVGCNSLAMAYYEGRGVVQDRTRAAPLYRRACEADWMWGCHNLGICYENGDGVPRASDQAIAFFQQACDGGLGKSCDKLGAMSRDGRGLPQSREAAYGYYARGCQGNTHRDQPDGNACNEACYMAQHGDGTSVDVSVTLNWCQRACNLDAQYCNNIAYMYEIGSGVARDQRQAARLYLRACDADAANATACRNLAGLYLGGRGVPQNRTEAIRLYRRACQLGHTESCNLLRQAGIALR